MTCLVPVVVVEHSYCISTLTLKIVFDCSMKRIDYFL